jgi:hypothetical protein
MPVMAWSFNRKITLVLSATEYNENVINVKNTELLWEAWTGLLGLRAGYVAGTCERSNEPLGITEYREFLD